MFPKYLTWTSGHPGPLDTSRKHKKEKAKIGVTLKEKTKKKIDIVGRSRDMEEAT